MSKQPEDDFLQKNFQYFQERHHWHDKAVSLRRAALVLYRANLPELRLYEKARRATLKELELRPVAPVRHPHPDVLPAFSLFGSALESIFKGVMVCNKPDLISAKHLSAKLKNHKRLELARNAQVTLSAQETAVLAWVTEVLIWKARYSVPTDMRFAEDFFLRLDNISLSDARVCTKTLEAVFARAKKALPRRVRRSRFDVLVRLD
jgi:hypothetical protein